VRSAAFGSPSWYEVTHLSQRQLAGAQPEKFWKQSITFITFLLFMLLFFIIICGWFQ